MVPNIRGLFPGIIASITKDPSPAVAIMAATTAPIDTIPCSYKATTAKAPRHPGVTPRNAAIKYCFHLDPDNSFCHLPSVITLIYSITSIITVTKEVIITDCLKTSSIQVHLPHRNIILIIQPTGWVMSVQCNKYWFYNFYKIDKAQMK